MIKWREAAGQTVAVVAFQFHRNGTVLTRIGTMANVRPCGTLALLWTDGHVAKHRHLFFTFLFLFTVFFFINVSVLCVSVHTHTRAHAHARAQSSAVFLPTTIIPFQDGQINYGLLDLETIVIAA